MDFSILKNAPFFRGLSLEEITFATSMVSYRIRSYRAGSLIAHSGDIVNSFTMVIEGVVKGEMIDFAGRIIKIENIPPSGALASAFIFGPKNTYPVNVVAVTDTRLMVIGKTEFLKLLKNNERLLENFLDIVSERSQFLSEKIRFLNFKTIRGKLAQYILELSGHDQNEITLTLTQAELAEYFGVARPSVARVMGELEENGIIEIRGRNLRIIDRDGLTGITME